MGHFEYYTCQEDPSPCLIISNVYLIHSQSSGLDVVSDEIRITLIKWQNNLQPVEWTDGLTQNKAPSHIRHNEKSLRRTGESLFPKTCDNLVICCQIKFSLESIFRLQRSVKTILLPCYVSVLAPDGQSAVQCALLPGKVYGECKCKARKNVEE